MIKTKKIEIVLNRERNREKCREKVETIELDLSKNNIYGDKITRGNKRLSRSKAIYLVRLAFPPARINYR